MPSRNSKQPAGCASAMVPSVTPVELRYEVVDSALVYVAHSAK